MNEIERKHADDNGVAVAINVMCGARRFRSATFRQNPRRLILTFEGDSCITIEDPGPILDSGGFFTAYTDQPLKWPMYGGDE